MGTAVVVLAKGWLLKIGGVSVGGIDTLTFSESSKQADATTRESLGMEEHLVATRGASISVKGKWLEDPDDGTRDAGQEAVELLATKIDRNSLAEFTLTSPGGAIGTFDASAEMGDRGGSNDEASQWNVKLTRSGAIVWS
ncbi:hypothetical protein M0R72_15630 [Candidatus Pacearchaeota archaeon]|jgi:hypothetical protein|nr:hypothetical protein [Candidatus Pacearchaeota archaeon]